jgi:hypothetical protein
LSLRRTHGRIDGKASGLSRTLRTISKLSEKDYSGSNLSVDDLNESNGQLVIDKQKSFYFKVKTIDKFKSYIKDPKSTINEQAFNERKKNVDIYVLGKYAQVAAGHCKFCQTKEGRDQIEAEFNKKLINQ